MYKGSLYKGSTLRGKNIQERKHQSFLITVWFFLEEEKNKVDDNSMTSSASTQWQLSLSLSPVDGRNFQHHSTTTDPNARVDIVAGVCARAADVIGRILTYAFSTLLLDRILPGPSPPLTNTTREYYEKEGQVRRACTRS